jgi:hypothetical protein
LERVFRTRARSYVEIEWFSKGGLVSFIDRLTDGLDVTAAKHPPTLGDRGRQENEAINDRVATEIIERRHHFREGLIGRVEDAAYKVLREYDASTSIA